jgi:hypothetical protein
VRYRYDDAARLTEATRLSVCRTVPDSRQIASLQDATISVLPRR